MVLGSLAQVVGYCLEAPAPPFPVFVLGYAINGFGMSLQVRNAHVAVLGLFNILLIRTLVRMGSSRP